MSIHHIHVARAAPYTQIEFIRIMFMIKLNTRAIDMIFTLSLILHIPANILKFIWSIKLKTRKSIEYFSITHDSINFSPKRIKAITSEKTKNKMLNAIHSAMKFLKNIDFTKRIFFVSHLLCISEKIGKSNQNIGPISKNGIHIILR